MIWRTLTILTVLVLRATDQLHDGPRRRHDDQGGMTTTEVAVVTFLLVAAAIVVMGVIYAAAKGNADAIPTPEAPAP